jgi:hypothetical protein
MTDTLQQVFFDKRQNKAIGYPIQRRWSDFPANRQAAIEGKPMPLNRPPRYSAEEIEYITREELKEMKK